MNAFRCDVCGRFVSYADLQSLAAVTKSGMEWDYGRDEPRETFECYHVRCVCPTKDFREPEAAIVADRVSDGSLESTQEAK